jgi:hypothetical protein
MFTVSIPTKIRSRAIVAAISLPETTQAHNTISYCIEYGRVGKFGGEIG